MYNTVFMQENDSFSSFYARLSAKTALCNWPIDQEKATLKDCFFGRIRDVEVQRQLIRAKSTSNCFYQRPSQTKPCYFCGNPFSLEHRRSCPAREGTCIACKNKGHFAKFCNTTKRRVNMVQQNDPASDQECGFIEVNDDSEPEYGVMAVDVIQINNVELLKAKGGQPRSLSIQLRSGNTFFMLRWTLAVLFLS